jgi:dipeptidyl aminopeptidase/acylaminoacyl peptidase
MRAPRGVEQTMTKAARMWIPAVAVVLQGALLTGCGGDPEQVVAQGAPDKALTLENIVGRQSGARQAALSPDGQWVALTGDGPQGTGIYVVRPNGTDAPRLLTEGSNPEWFPDGTRLVFSRESDLWTIATGGGEPSRVTSDQENERAARVSPDGRTIAFYSSRGGHQDIWLVPADGSAPARQLTRESMAEDDPRFAPSWSPDGRQIAYVSNKADYWHDDVWVIDVESGKARQLSKALMAASVPAWSPDGRRLALLGNDKKGYWYEDLQDIWVLDAASGNDRAIEMQVYATDSLHNLPVLWSGNGEHFYFVYHERGDYNLWSVPAKGGIATKVTHGLGSLRSLTTTKNGDAFAWVRSGPEQGPEIEYIPKIGGRARQLTQFSEEWQNVDAPIEVSYRSFDGLYIQGFLYLPPGMQPDAKYPALVQVHGGGTNSYLRTQNLLEHYLASKGYVVMAINYRGGSGFGREFQDIGVNDWVGGQAHDAAMAADFMRSLPYVNGKVGIYGYSYGGIMTLGTIARHPDKYDAAVPMAGIYDFGDALTNADRLGKIFAQTGHGGPPDQRKEVYDRSNTLLRVQNIETPLLIMHGEADVRAPFRQYEMAVALLKKHGKTFESKSYPGEPHGFRNPANRLDMYQRLEAFLDKHLKQ